MSKSTTTTQKNEPPAWAKPLFEQSADSAKWLYDNKVGFNTYEGDRIANFNANQTQALRDLGGLDAWNPQHQQSQAILGALGSGNMLDAANPITDQANSLMGTLGRTTYDPSNSIMDQGTGVYQGLLGQNIGPDNAATRNAQSVFAGMTDGGVGTNRFEDIYNSAGQLSSAEQNLQSIAAGKSLMGDPLFQEMLDAQSAKIADQVNSGFSAAGRYGSAAHAGTVGDSVGDFRRQAVLDNYAAERQRQLQAINAIDQGRLGRQGMQSSAAGSIAGIQGGNMDRNLGAAQMLGASGQQSIQNQMAEAARRQSLGGALSQTGQQIFANQQSEAARRGQMSALLAQQGQNLFANQQSELARKQSVAGDLANLGQQKYSNAQNAAMAQLQAGTLQQQQAQAEMDAQIKAWNENQNEAWTRLGALQAAAAGAAGPYGMAQNTSSQPFNPLGILGAIFGMSDRRLKQDIVLVGERGGFNWYEFAYTNAPDMRWRGVMADEVQAVRPDAVRDVGGYLQVDYPALGLQMEAV